MDQKLKSTFTPAFPLGDLGRTIGVAAAIPVEEMLEALMRHASCDWGDICDEDRGQNEEALREGSRLFSVYHSRKGVKFWIITEWNRSATTIMLPSEY